MDGAIGSLELTLCEVGQLVQETVESMRQKAAQRDQAIVLAGLDESRYARVDPVRFKQAIGNVLSNALRFAPAGSDVDVQCASAAGGDVLHVTVRDRGPGIPEPELEAIFGAFVQSSRTQDGSGGTGLGLTIARRIVSAHGGQLTASNAGDGGAIFHISVPQSPAPSPGERVAVVESVEA